MAPKERPSDITQRKPGEATLQYYYACTVKPNMVADRNDKIKLDLCVEKQFCGLNIQDRKYEMDAKGVLHVHFTLVTRSKFKSYYAFFKKGWSIHLSLIKDKLALCRWKHYLTKGDPDDQVLLLAHARTTYLFQ